jgi:ATP adenylyltransferase
VLLLCAPELDDDEAMILERRASTFTLMNAYPYTSGHLLIAPLRTKRRWWGSPRTRRPTSCLAIQRANRALVDAYQPGGINVGANVGPRPAAVPRHVHVHVLPAGTATRTS